MFSVYSIRKVFSPAGHLLSLRTELVKEGMAWDAANDMMESLRTWYLAKGGMRNNRSQNWSIVDDGVVPMFVDGIRTEETMTPYGTRKDGWSMHDGKPMFACLQCGTWGDGGVDCCSIADLPSGHPPARPSVRAGD